MLHDLVNSLAIENTIIPQSFTNSDTATGADVDITGFRRVAFVVELGSLSAAGISITFEGKDADDAYTELDDDDLISDDAMSDITEIAADADETVHTFGLKTGGYKAVRAKVDADTDSGAGDLSVAVAKMSKYDEPV